MIPWLRRPGAKLLIPNWLAITIGRDIFTWRALSPVELEHELEHVRQWRRLGAWYAVAYAAASWQSWRGGSGWYWGNRFEVEARGAATRLQEELAAGAGT